MNFNGEWEKVKLGKLIKTRKGNAFKSKDYQDKGVKIVKVTNFTNNSINIKDCTCIDEQRKSEFKDYVIVEDDILISSVGSWPNNPDSVVGKVVKVPQKASGTLLNQNIVRVRTDDHCVSQNFLYYSLKDDRFKNYLISGARGSANQASITLKSIKNFEFKLPSLEEQKAISNILSYLDKKIELNNQMNQTLEKIAQAIYKNWFIDFEPFQDEEFVESELGMIPEGWEIGTIGDLVKIQNGYAFKSKNLSDDGEVGVIKISNVQENGVDINNTQYLDQDIVDGINSRYKINPQSILIALTGEVGRMGLIPNNKRELLLNQRVGMLIPKKEFGKTFIYNLLKTSKYKNIIESRSRGSVQKNISATDISKIRIILPSKNLIKEFEKISNIVFKKISNNLYQNQILKELRDTLLPKLMSGEIRVESFEKERG